MKQIVDDQLSFIHNAAGPAPVGQSSGAAWQAWNARTKAAKEKLDKIGTEDNTSPSPKKPLKDFMDGK